MMGRACFNAEVLLERSKSRISEAEQLVLETHLGECARCRAQASALGELEDLVDGVGRELAPSARERAILRALNSAGSPRAARPPASRWRLAALSGGVAIAFAAAWIFVAAGTGDRVLNGEVTAEGRSLHGGDSLPERTAIGSAQGARIAVAHAEVQLEAGGEVEWAADTNTLVLRARSIEVAVDPKPHKRFRVATERFIVEVIGTRFHVEPDGVTVSEGVVSVRDHAGGVLVERLVAGSRFTMPARVAAAAVAPVEVAPVEASGDRAQAAPREPSVRTAVDGERADAPKRRSGAMHRELASRPAVSAAAEAAGRRTREALRARALSDGPGSSEALGSRADEAPSPSSNDRAAAAATPALEPRTQARPQPESAAVFLGRARRALALHDAEAARTLVAEARARPLARDGEAEADTLEAECALVSGNGKEAARRYAEVADRYPDLSAGENALFAAGRIEAELGDSARALGYDRRYLERYPHGSFRAEAERRIAALAAETR